MPTIYQATSGDFERFEGDSISTLALESTQNITSDLVVNYTLGGTATPNVDYTISGGTVNYSARTGTLTIPAGTSAFSGIDNLITLHVTADNISDDNETIIFTLVAGTGYTLGNDTRRTITVRDRPLVSFAAASGTVAENGGTRNVAVSISPAPTANITVNYTVGGTAGSSDFSISGSGTVTVAANATSVNIPVGITDDSVAENSETVILTLSSGTGYNLGSANVHTLTITDDDTATPALSISGDGAVTEGSEAVFTVTASAAQGGSQRVLYILSDATGSDFLDDALEGDNSSFFFPRNETSYSLRIATTDDSVEEQSGDITVTLRLRNGSNYVLGSPFSATVRVNDDDSGTPPPPPEPVEPVVTLPRVSISGGGAVTEGGDAVFTLTVSPPPPAGETVTVAVQVSQSGRVVASGESGRRTVVVDDRGAASFTVTTSDDAIDEPDGAVIVTVRNGNGYRVGSRSSASVGVNDDDPGLVPSTVSLAVLRGGAGRFSLKLDTAPTATVAVTVSVSDGKGWMVDTDPGSPGKQTTLLFTPTNWNQPQEVVVSAGQEGEGVATVVINASGGDYEGLRAAIRVEVVEQDQGTATEAAKGWQVRFGRTVAQQVVDAVQGRLTAAPSPVGLHLTVAGEDLSGMPLEENEGALAKVLGFETVTTGQVMQDSAFSFSPPSPSPTAAPTAAPPAAAGAAEGGEGDTRGRGRSRGRWRTPVGHLG